MYYLLLGTVIVPIALTLLLPRLTGTASVPVLADNRLRDVMLCDANSRKLPLITNVFFLIAVVIFPIAGLVVLLFCSALCLIQIGFWNSIRRRDSLGGFFAGRCSPEEDLLRRSFSKVPMRYLSVLVTSLVIGGIIARLYYAT